MSLVQDDDRVEQIDLKERIVSYPYYLLILIPGTHIIC